MTKDFKQMVIATILTGLLCCGFLAFSSPAEAFCLYNHSTHPVHARIGAFGFWTVHPANKKCTNGTGGVVSIEVLAPNDSTVISEEAILSVDDHGWISVFKKKDGKWKVENKRKDGSIKEVQYMDATK